MTETDKEYWVLRLAQAVDNAIEAPTERSRIAYLELARHYWSMHVMINGQHRYAGLKPAGGDAGESALRRAA